MAVYWVILRGQLVIQAVHSLLCIVPKCHFFSFVTWKDIIKYFVRGFQKTQWTNTSRWHCTPNHHRLWKCNTGLQATWAMSFSTRLDSMTLVSKWNTKLALIWKEDFGPLGNNPVLLLLSPGNTPLTTTVAKFLDMSVCGGSWCFDPSLSPFLVKFTQIAWQSS